MVEFRKCIAKSIISLCFNKLEIKCISIAEVTYIRRYIRKTNELRNIYIISRVAWKISIQILKIGCFKVDIISFNKLSHLF